MKSSVGKTLVYIYLLRFSLILWLFPFAFALLDSGWLPFSTTTLTRGMFVPEYWSGYLCVTFYLNASGFVALVTARTVVINGSERFRAPCPDWLKSLLADSDGRGEVKPVLYALLPTVLTICYLLIDGPLEGVDSASILKGVLWGVAAAFFFWYVINAWYYLAYEPPGPPVPDALLELGVNAARTILFPRRLFFLKRPGALAVDHDKTLEDITTQLRDSSFVKLSHGIAAWLNGKWGLPGYVYNGDKIYEAQIFSFVAAIGFIALFWVLYPLTAPVPTRWVLASFVIILVSLVTVVRFFLGGQCPNRKVLRVWQWVLSLCATGFCSMIPVVWYRTDPERFPILASVLLMVILLGWTFSGLAFFLDRYRIPVLTLFILTAVIPRAFFHHVYEGIEEHYVSTTVPPANGKVQTPAEILWKRMETVGVDRPLIIVTATGGGLHASAWTARVLRQLNDEFEKEEDRKSFRSHILLLSTVSGGSVGASYYLRELALAKNAPPNFDRMVIASQCSSLEAVGWGLVYYDLTKAFVPLASFAPWLRPSSGVGDLDQSPLGKDRTWSLRRGMQRNSSDGYCYDSAKDLEGAQPEPPSKPSLVDLLWPTSPSPVQRQTLAGLAPTLDNDMPAFTMNTTTAEGGDRFLLANYRLPIYLVGPIEGQPAESFLSLKFPSQRHADLPLASAAQLSATFPYVSSAVRIPESYTKYSDHFVDGGYYDNDGTASAIEFLRYALDPPVSETPDDSDAKNRDSICNKLGISSLKVLLIEIRNSADSDGPGVPATPKALNPPGSDPSGLLEQLTKPLEGFWNAGHQSITGRNRNGLDLFIQGHPNVELHQIVLDDKTVPGSSFGIKEAQDPLSWSLTPKQRKEAKDSSESLRMQDCYRVVKEWFDGGWDSSAWRTPTRCAEPPTVAPVTVNREVRDSVPGDYLRVGFMNPGTKVTTLSRPGAVRALATATRPYTPPVKLRDIVSNMGLDNDDGKMLVAMRCRPPHSEKVDALVATWPNVFLAPQRDIVVPPAACTGALKAPATQLACFAHEFHDDAITRTSASLANTFGHAGVLFNDALGQKAFGAWLKDNFGIFSAFAGSGYSVADSDQNESSAMTSLQILANSASPEYILKNVTLTDAGCRCIAVAPYSGWSNYSLDPAFITKAGSQGF